MYRDYRWYSQACDYLHNIIQKKIGMPLHKSKYSYKIRNRVLKSAHNNNHKTIFIIIWTRTTLNDLYFYRERPFNLIYCSTLLYSYYKQINFFPHCHIMNGFDIWRCVDGDIMFMTPSNFLLILPLYVC